MPDSPPATVNRDSVLDLAIAAKVNGKIYLHDMLVAVAGTLDPSGIVSVLSFDEGDLGRFIDIDGPFGRGLKLIQKRNHP